MSKMWKPWNDSISDYIENLRNHLLFKPLTDCKIERKYGNCFTPIEISKVKLVYHDWIKITNRRFLHLVEMIQQESIWNGYDASNKNLNEKGIEIDVRNLQGTPLIFSKWACKIP